MKKYLFHLKFVAAVLVVSACFHSCVKDTCTKSYTIYTPVYKTLAEARASIKTSGPTPIKNPGKLFVIGNFIFLNEVDKGIHIIDNKNPAAPVNKYFVPIPGNLDVAVNGSTLYADMFTDMVTMDVSDPGNIQLKQVADSVFQKRVYTNNFVPEKSKVIVDWVAKDTSITADCNNPVSSRRRDGVFFALSSASPAAPGVAGSMARFCLLNNYLYTVTENALNVFNISQPQLPVFTNKVNLGWGIETIYPFQNNLFIGSAIGMFIYGTTNPSLPNRISSFSHARACDPVVADKDFAYITLRSGTACNSALNQLDVVNIKNLSAPVLVKTYLLHNPHGLSKDENILLVCDGTDGLKMYDASTVTNLKLLKTVSGIDTYDVIALNGIAIVVAKDGLYQYDYSSKSDLKLLSKVAL